MHGSFISFTKRELNTRVLLGTSSRVTTLKTPFSSNPVISFCLDAVHWGGWAPASVLVNVSSLSMTKQISGDAMFTCSGCFLGCPRPNLIGAEGADVGGACVGGTCGGGACIGGACIGGACAGGYLWRGCLYWRCLCL